MEFPQSYSTAPRLSAVLDLYCHGPGYHIDVFYSSGRWSFPALHSFARPSPSFKWGRQRRSRGRRQGARRGLPYHTVYYYRPYPETSTYKSWIRRSLGSDKSTKFLLFKESSSNPGVQVWDWDRTHARLGSGWLASHARPTSLNSRP